ncbi:D-cysteine desulfhydrase family protein [Microbulbifer yueqingensis]|uniref:D-cysteine desulfhydrase n=1 Tax=Microbulbifer yueqingensis TaxID=658219 RepID=A0A1G9EGF9_9GAMM|nr:D-cysteine desulfhydrase family protein [Microbulbifer yueqingensis]SDK75240.1 D-cysteine desulfhydrase [Microbulbifer yueqingensis]
MLTDKLPRESLGFFPTPLHALERLSDALGGPRLFIKRDDQTGLALGGNKTRKLEFILADALERGADTIVTAGASQSNHCRQTAAAAAALGLECHLLLGGRAPDGSQGNLLLDQLFGSHFHWAGEHRKGEDLREVMRYLESAGRRPYLVPYGGSSELGTIAFVAALEELQRQWGGRGRPFTHIVFASSSGGTHAGLMLGARLLRMPTQIVGIGVDKDMPGERPYNAHIIELAGRASARLGRERRFGPEDLWLEEGYQGEGYGVVGPAEREAISLLARTEGILLDPVYTGRAMAGLLDMVRRGVFDADDRVLFWHTGGAPAIFAYADELQPE